MAYIIASIVIPVVFIFATVSFVFASFKKVVISSVDEESLYRKSSIAVALIGCAGVVCIYVSTSNFCEEKRQRIIELRNGIASPSIRAEFIKLQIASNASRDKKYLEQPLVVNKIQMIEDDIKRQSVAIDVADPELRSVDLFFTMMVGSVSAFLGIFAGGICGALIGQAISVRRESVRNASQLLNG